MAKRATVTVTLRAVAMVLVGLLAGAMQEEYFFLEVVVHDLTPDVWARVQSNFRHLHPYTVVPAGVVSVIALVFTLVLERGGSPARRRLTIAAATSGVLVGVLTVVVMVPLNDAIYSWTINGVPSDWTRIRDRWIGFQAVRAVVSVSGFICLVVAAVLPETSPRREGHVP